jgi:uncharacterized cupredoxin-like copper-binding protein
MPRRLILVFAAAALAAMLLAACGGGGGGGGGTTGGAALDVTETATEFKFDPATINAAPGQTINLTVKNAGTIQHTWVLPQANVKITIDPGKSVTQSFKAPTSPGTYQFECDVAGHKEAGMVGQLIVR